MQRLQRKIKPLLTTLPLIWGTISLISCAGLPPPPEGQLGKYSHSNQTVFWSDLKDGHSLPSMSITQLSDLSQIDNDFLLPPDTLESLNNYIDELIRRLQSKSFATTSASARPYYKLTLDDLYAIRRKLNDIKEQAAHESRSSDSAN